MYAETQFAVSLYGARPSETKTQLTFKKPKEQALQKTASRSRSSAKKPETPECRVCEKKHPEVWHSCPLLKEIQWKKTKLPRRCCVFCLGRTNAAGKCITGGNCWVYTAAKGGNFNH